ncbi:MAG: ABC transporter substrate-binding protein [Candidatus Bathyarchaeia archaeon]
MRKALFSLIVILMISILVMSTGPVFAKIEHYGHPRLDEAYMKVVLTPDAQCASFEACDVEMLPDMITRTHILKLMRENQILLASPGYHYCYIAMNCRDYVPCDYNQPDCGRPLAPLNWTDFRQALAWAGLSMAEKEQAILEIYGGPIVTPVCSPVPPIYGFWYNDALVCPGCNFTKAWEILQASGFYIQDGLLYQPNGNPVRDEIEVLSPAPAPTSVAFTQKWVDKWNKFFGEYLGVTNCKFKNNPIATDTLIERAFDYRNFDLYFLCWGLGRYPDYLYDFFHSSMEGPGNNNAPGIKDPTLDHYLEILKWGTVREEKIQACHIAQKLLVEDLVPCVYLYSRTYYTAFKNYTYYNPADPRHLVNMVNMKGLGADNGWTWALMHWNTAPTGGMLKYCLTGNVYEFHPGWAEWAYEWDVLNRVLDGLLALNPYTLEDIPWIAGSWSIEPFEWEPLNVYGQKIRFTIREGVLWHDYKPVTVEDIKFAMDFIKNFPRYESIWQYILWSQIVDPYTIDIYLNTTSQFIYADLAGIALMFPKHIYGPGGWLETHGYDPINAEVWTIDYNVGEARKALVGCGPYVFDYFDPTTNIVHVVKFTKYWVDGPLKQDFIMPARIDPDQTFLYNVTIINTGSIDEETGEIVPAVIDGIKIYVDGMLELEIAGPIVLGPFESKTFGPYELELEPGLHEIKCETYAYEELYDTYTKKVWATLKQDINLDIYVGIDDIFAAAKAFGSQPPPFPGHERWDERCDINGDYYVGIDDIFAIARKFGWP